MRPFKEVILCDYVNVSFGSDNNNTLYLTDDTNFKFKLKEDGVQVIWSGSIAEFKNKFGIPNDAPLSTKETKLPDGDNANFVRDWNLTTLNFKFNYHIWYKDGVGTGYYVLGSNHTINLTIPNVLVFDGNNRNNNSIKYASTGGTPRLYNPNMFPIPINITSFPTSNKTNDFQQINPSGTNSIAYLIFRYGVGGKDIQICLITRNDGAFQINNKTMIIPYMSLTFTGFNVIERLK